MAKRAPKSRKSELGEVFARIEQALAVGRGGVDALKAFAAALEKSSADYRKTHWGQKPREIVMVDAADPSGALALPALGKLHSITYETRKGKDRKPVLYEHVFENPRPLLLYAPHLRGRLIIAGGSYRVDERGIVG